MLEGPIFGEAYLRREICVSKSYIVGKKFNVFALFCFVFKAGQLQSTAPRGAYIRRGDLTEGFLRYEFGGAYIWRGLFSEFYGIFIKISS